MPSINTEYLHDATVSEIGLRIDDRGNRQLQMRLCCDPDCGCDELNGRVMDVFFNDPIVILGELYGHMANAESFDSWNDHASDNMKRRITRLAESGLPAPKHFAELVFHSGSLIEVACDEIQFQLM